MAVSPLTGHCLCQTAHGAPFVMWSGVKATDVTKFCIRGEENTSYYRSSSNCARYFCKTCGTHVYISYDVEELSSWSGEIHFPTALLNEESVAVLEQTMQDAGKPRYLHVFLSDKSSCLGNFHEWANGPKYGGSTGLEPLPEIN